MSRPQVNPQDVGKRPNNANRRAGGTEARRHTHARAKSIMTRRIIYEVRCHEGAWSVCCRSEVVASFMRRERAVRFADLIAQRNFRRNGIPAVVRLVDGGEAVDIALHGDRDPAANALAWIRHVSALRETRESEQHDPYTTRRRA